MNSSPNAFAHAETVRILRSHVEGKPHALDDWLPSLYAELRRLAERYLRGERKDHTLQPTDLIHEAYLSMVGDEAIDVRSKTAFFALASYRIRQVLVEHARRRQRKKRGGEWARITLTPGDAVESGSPLDVVELDDAIQALARKNERQSQIVVLRLFGGLSVSEAAESLSVSERTIKADWAVGRARLIQALQDLPDRQAEES